MPRDIQSFTSSSINPIRVRLHPGQRPQLCVLLHVGAAVANLPERIDGLPRKRIGEALPCLDFVDESPLYHTAEGNRSCSSRDSQACRQQFPFFSHPIT